MKRIKLQIIIALAIITIPFLMSSSGKVNNNNLQITIENIRSGEGKLMIAVGDYPADMENMTGKAVAISGQSITTDFSDLPLGRVSVYVFHNENDNSNLDFGKNHIPLEGCAISSVDIEEGSNKITIPLVYYLNDKSTDKSE